MNYNKYEEIINGKATYKEIAFNLFMGNSVMIGWSDETYTHLDILFNYCHCMTGEVRRGFKKNYLYVSIIDYTSYGFDATNEKCPSYIKEKLRFNNECGDKVAELINGVIRYMNVIKGGSIDANNDIEIIG